MTDPRVRVELQRSGGVTGIPLKASVDTRDLEEPEAQELRALVDRADVPALAERSSGPGPGQPDRFEYELTVTIDDRPYQIRLGETEVTEKAKPLIQRLLDLARRR